MVYHNPDLAVVRLAQHQRVQEQVAHLAQHVSCARVPDPDPGLMVSPNPNPGVALTLTPARLHGGRRLHDAPPCVPPPAHAFQDRACCCPAAGPPRPLARICLPAGRACGHGCVWRSVHGRARPAGAAGRVRAPVVDGLIASQEHALLGAVDGRDVHREQLEDVPPLRHRGLAWLTSRALVAKLVLAAGRRSTSACKHC